MTDHDPRHPALDLDGEDVPPLPEEPNPDSTAPVRVRPVPEFGPLASNGWAEHELAASPRVVANYTPRSAAPETTSRTPKPQGSPADSFPMAEAAGIPWRADGQPVEWAPRPNSLFDGRPWVRVEGGGVASPPWVGAPPAEKAEDDVDRAKRARALVREVVETSLLAVLVFLCVRATFQNFKVDGTSMFPTLENGEFLVVNKLVYAEVNLEKIARFLPFVDPGDEPVRHVFGAPKRGDIIVLKHPSHPDTDLIKRVIGLPGETIEVRGNDVYVNDRLLVEPYIEAPGGNQQDRTRVPEGEYFVMGDNRAHSSDSRAFGFVPEELIIGRSIVIYWPTDRFGLAPNEEATVQAAFLPLTAATAPFFGTRSAIFFIELLLVITIVRRSFRSAVLTIASARDRRRKPLGA